MAGNWKMNLNHAEAVMLVQKLAWILTDKRHDFARTEVVVLPPFTDLRSVQTVVDGDRLALKYGAQDVSAHGSGAYTGEISAGMLARLGCSYVVVGHSERREYHRETDEQVNAKARAALTASMTPIVCVGEGLDVRTAGEQVPYSPGSLRRRSADWSSPTSPSGRSAPARSPPPRTRRRSVRPSARDSVPPPGTTRLRSAGSSTAGRSRPPTSPESWRSPTWMVLSSVAPACRRTSSAGCAGSTRCRPCDGDLSAA
jgi:hypothetical protein